MPRRAARRAWRPARGDGERRRATLCANAHVQVCRTAEVDRVTAHVDVPRVADRVEPRTGQARAWAAFPAAGVVTGRRIAWRSGRLALHDHRPNRRRPDDFCPVDVSTRH
jgi:hypothetical protein